LGWRAISCLAGAVAGLIAQRTLEPVWRGLRRGMPPPATADRRSSWVEALSWAIATGVGMGVTRLLAVRSAAAVWEAATHELPPEPALFADAAAS